jgi:hypothetical protein
MLSANVAGIPKNVATANIQFLVRFSELLFMLGPVITTKPALTNIVGVTEVHRPCSLNESSYDYLYATFCTYGLFSARLTVFCTVLFFVIEMPRTTFVNLQLRQC